MVWRILLVLGIGCVASGVALGFIAPQGCGSVFVPTGYGCPVNYQVPVFALIAIGVVVAAVSFVVRASRPGR